MPNKTPPAKVDPRVKRTRRLLRDVLVSLILEKDFASITIKEITERAEVAYITFFRHFESSALETEGRLIFEYIEQKADLFRILFKSQSVTRVRKKVVRNIAAIFQKSCLPLARSGNQTTTAILSNHIATSLLALIEWWLDNHMKPAPSEMGKVYKSLIIDSTVGALSSLSVV